MGTVTGGGSPQLRTLLYPLDLLPQRLKRTAGAQFRRRILVAEVEVVEAVDTMTTLEHVLLRPRTDDLHPIYDWYVQVLFKVEPLQAVIRLGAVGAFQS